MSGNQGSGVTVIGWRADVLLGGSELSDLLILITNYHGSRVIPAANTRSPKASGFSKNLYSYDLSHTAPFA